MKKLILMSLILFTCHQASADVASLESNFVTGEAIPISKLNNDRTTLMNSVNNVQGVYTGSVQSSGQVKADTIGEENMADDANPRIRTEYGASCADLVYSGLQASTTSYSSDPGTRIPGTISAGIAFPDGYYCDVSSTAKAFDKNMWVYVYLDTDCGMVYRNATIGGAEPTQPDNTAKLCRVSTDSTNITNVEDLRLSSCAAGPFEDIADATGEGTLDDMFRWGSPSMLSSSQGHKNGLWVSYDTHTTIKVTAGAAYINGKFRYTSSDITVPITADAPLLGTSGIDSGSPAASTTYYVYAVGDKANSTDLSVSFTTSATEPAGTTNSRYLGSIRTDADTLFTSMDIINAHGPIQREIPGAWVVFDGTASTPAPIRSLNVSSITDNGTGDYTINFIKPFVSADFATVCTSEGAAGVQRGYVTTAPAGNAPGSVQIYNWDNNGSTVADSAKISCMMIGDLVR